MSSSNFEGLPRSENTRINEVVEVFNPGTVSEVRLSSYIQDDVIHISASGPMDSKITPGLRGILDRQTDFAPEITTTEFDFSGVNFVESSVLGSLVNTLRRMKLAAEGTSQEPSVRIKLKDKMVARIFEITQLDQVLEVQVVDPENPSAEY